MATSLVLRGGSRAASMYRPLVAAGHLHTPSRVGALGMSAPDSSYLISGRQQRRWLPLCTVDANVSRDSIDNDFLPGFSKLLAETLNKLEKLISLTLRTDVQICRDGTSSPSAVVHIWSIGVFDEQRNPGYSTVFMDYMAPRLGMSSDRIVIFFHPVTKTDAGHLLYADQQQK